MTETVKTFTTEWRAFNPHLGWLTVPKHSKATVIDGQELTDEFVRVRVRCHIDGDRSKNIPITAVVDVAFFD